MAKLVEEGANVNTKNNSKMTLVHIGAYHGNPEVMRTCLANNADPNGQDDSDFTSMHHATLRNQFNSIKILYASHS